MARIASKFRKARKSDAKSWVKMAAKLFKQSTKQELKKDFEKIMASNQQAILLAIIDKKAIGFAHASIRTDYVEGSTSSPVGYLEGIYVRKKHRSKGLAKRLNSKVEKWASKRGCSEMGSDTWLWNKGAQAFHTKIGYTEDDRLVHYIKGLKL